MDVMVGLVETDVVLGKFMVLTAIVGLVEINAAIGKLVRLKCGP
jgi:hypothetical protein